MSAAHNPNTKVVRVAWVMTRDVRPYRVPLIERLSRRSEMIVDLYHGPPKAESGAPAQAPDLANIGIRVFPLKGTRWPLGRRPLAWLWGTFRIMTGDYDIVICQETVNNLSVWAFALLHRLFRKRFILHGWGYRPTKRGDPAAALRHAARRVLLRTADGVITYTDRGRQACLKFGIPSASIFVSGNTLDIEWLQSLESAVPPEEIHALRKSLSIDGNGMLLFVGRLQSAKRTDVLIEAVGILRGRGICCTLVVVGDGPDRPRLEAMARDADGVTFLGAQYDERRLAAYFMAADLLVIPGRVGLTCVHAFSHGLPVLTTTEEAIPQTPEYDYVVDDENGAIVEQLTPHAYADAIQGILADPGHLERLQMGARASADGLSMGRMVESFVAAVRYVAAR